MLVSWIGDEQCVSDSEGCNTFVGGCGYNDSCRVGCWKGFPWIDACNADAGRDQCAGDCQIFVVEDGAVCHTIGLDVDVAGGLGRVGVACSVGQGYCR